MSETNDDPGVAAVVSGAAWYDFCDQLKAAGQFIIDHSHASDVVDRVEGFRYLSRLTRAGLESFVESGNPRFPTINNLPNQVKIGSDNPDAFYQSVNISGDHSYRVWGNRGTVHYLGFGAYGGNYGAGQDRLGLGGYVDAGDLEIDGAGNFELIVGGDERPGNWIAATPGGGVLIIRQFYLDRESEVPARLKIERLGESSMLMPMSPHQFKGALEFAVAMATGTMERFTGNVERWASERPNTLEVDDQLGTNAWGDPNQIFRHGYWTLNQDEMLVISFTPPPVFYWNFQLDNLWMESLDYRFNPVTINKHTARYEPDGSVRIVVAHEDPGFGNWMATCGHRHGAMGLRWNQAEYDVQPVCEVRTAGVESTDA